MGIQVYFVDLKQEEHEPSSFPAILYLIETLGSVHVKIDVWTRPNTICISLQNTALVQFFIWHLANPFRNNDENCDKSEINNNRYTRKRGDAINNDSYKQAYLISAKC